MTREVAEALSRLWARRGPRPAHHRCAGDVTCLDPGRCGTGAPGDEPDPLVDDDWVGRQLMARLRRLGAIGATRASMGPRLRPIYASVVAQVTDTMEAPWEPVRVALRADDRPLHARLLALHAKGGPPRRGSTIRVLDVIARLEGKAKGVEGTTLGTTSARPGSALPRPPPSPGVAFPGWAAPGSSPAEMAEPRVSAACGPVPTGGVRHDEGHDAGTPRTRRCRHRPQVAVVTGRGDLWGDRVRGLVLGLALGDSVGSARGELPSAGPLRAGVTTQLAAFTIDGVVRAVMRSLHKGICHPPSVVWHAYCRWAALQGIDPEAMRRRWDSGTEQPWPDGWLAQVPALGERRGNAPATVAALRNLEQGTVEKPTTRSRGCHALTRTLPLAAMSYQDLGYLTEFARDVAALTHGDPQAHAATCVGAHLAAQALTAETVDRAVNATFTVAGAELDAGVMMGVDHAQQAAAKHPRQTDWLRQLAPDATAASALLGGVYVALSYPGPGEAMEALAFASTAPDPDSVAAVTGAILGALHGADAWPVALLSRHELVWVLDTLARDLVLQLTDNPGGAEYEQPRDPHWWDRYPGC